ncbi:MAG: hypothetical protein SGI87_09390 [Flavobacteriales bacterium]|nr:hypothetical protein [Flavobacteriales bacterium]
MKKILAILFAVLYFVSNSGAVVNMHFCKGRLVEFKIWAEVEGCGGQKSCGKKCCKDISINLQSSDEQMRPSPASAPEFFAFAIPASSFQMRELSIFANSLILSQTRIEPPPLSWGLPLYLRLDTFRL